MQGLFISLMCHIKLIAETRIYICHKNMKSIFLKQFLESFHGKTCKKDYKGNEEWKQSETAKVQVIMYFEHFISSLADNTNELPKNEQYFYFSFCRRYRDFP